MTNTQDLSLLTDEERVDLDSLRNALENDAAQLTREFHKVHLESVERWVTRLIAARAENKRKDEVITKLIDAAEQGRNLLRQVAEVGSLAGRRGAHGRADAIDAVLKEAAALLQSKKGA
jgi:hypothetical protein